MSDFRLVNSSSTKHIITVDEKFLAFKKIKLIFTRNDFDQSIPVGCKDFNGNSKYTAEIYFRTLGL
jgi:hypothetical protein